MSDLLTFNATQPGVLECALDISLLFDTKKDLKSFDGKWEDFSFANEDYSSIFERKNQVLLYKSESLVPRRIDDRSPVLFIFGNPASKSVLSGMCFAFEGDLNEHRIWPALRKSNWLIFNSDKNQDEYNWSERNQKRKEEIFNLDYKSPYRLGITVFYTFPSPASHAKWSGVSGIRRLFGLKALRRIAHYEKKRLRHLLQKFMVNEKGTVLTFQKDAYEGLKGKNTPPYKIEDAKEGSLIGSIDINLSRSNLLIGCPPTRYAHSKNFQNILRNIHDLVE